MIQRVQRANATPLEYPREPVDLDCLRADPDPLIGPKCTLITDFILLLVASALLLQARYDCSTVTYNFIVSIPE